MNPGRGPIPLFSGPEPGDGGPGRGGAARGGAAGGEGAAAEEGDGTGRRRLQAGLSEMEDTLAEARRAEAR